MREKCLTDRRLRSMIWLNISNRRWRGVLLSAKSQRAADGERVVQSEKRNGLRRALPNYSRERRRLHRYAQTHMMVCGGVTRKGNVSGTAE